MPVERYAAVLKDLRAKILDGTYPVNYPLPHTDQLKETYGVAAATITRVMSVLKAEGLIWRVANRGMIVQPPPIPVDLAIAAAPHNEHTRWSEACRRAGITGQLREGLAAFTTAADHQTAAALRVAEGEPVVWWSRVAVVGERPAVFHDRVYYPPGIVRDVPAGVSVRQVFEYVLTRIDPATSYAHSTTTVRPATDDEASMFKISAGMPVYDVTRVIYDQHDQPYELLRRVANPLRVRLVERGLPLS
ncbi:GntR family transcriptional regulator [Microbispora bryophytorum]|uniref:GntR family transcriptional regulator n=1 Tax=Microbispora bryophytorum TaxID=1460882 RepID=UPI0033FEE4BF